MPFTLFYPHGLVYIFVYGFKVAQANRKLEAFDKLKPEALDHVTRELQLNKQLKVCGIATLKPLHGLALFLRKNASSGSWQQRLALSTNHKYNV